ncbi:hypothetical protein [Cellulosimicrobium marinum]|uniref:hypothetical protein n=1 Tax=Cellulosimicrobium marinum TaxID=1638992 RepID=UPI001E4A838F|nr:hypothetical protein [Cellulosimicrobium marinum]MCB7135688.1 hypothetical protein [Cellulosimicrobium marinum]
MTEHDERPRKAVPRREPARVARQGATSSATAVAHRTAGLAVLQHEVGNAQVSRALGTAGGAVVQRAVTPAEVRTLPEEVKRAVVVDFPRVLSAVLNRTVSLADVLAAAKDLATLDTDARFYLQHQGQVAAAVAQVQQQASPDALRQAVEDDLVRDLRAVPWLPQGARDRIATDLAGRVRVLDEVEFARRRVVEWGSGPAGAQSMDAVLRTVMGSWRSLGFAERNRNPRHLNLRQHVVKPHHAIHEALHILSGAGWDKHVGDGDATGWPALVEGATEITALLVLKALGKPSEGDYYRANKQETASVIKQAGISFDELITFYFQDASVFRGVLKIKEDVQGGGAFISSAVLGYQGRKKKAATGSPTGTDVKGATQ